MSSKLNAPSLPVEHELDDAKVSKFKFQLSSDPKFGDLLYIDELLPTFILVGITS